MMKKGTLLTATILTLALMAGTALRAQENITPLAVNPVIYGKKLPIPTANQKITLTLPFLEDFSNGKWYPNPLKWTDAMVFINDDYPVKPPSIGVATFDALNALGAVYSNASSFPFPADTLTSQPIDLSSLSRADSVFMSFHYQPAGIGNAPERDDSLLLEFWSNADQEWYHVWADRGRTMDAFLAEKGKHFPIVVVPVDSALFFSPSFRFRFRNYASITDQSLPDWGGNVDMWHVDYIYINSGRNSLDTLINNDIAFRDYPRSMLNKYYSMPWNQYQANALAETRHDVAIPYSSYYYNQTNSINQIFHVNSLTGGTSYSPTPYNFGNLPMPVDTVVIAKPATGFDTFIFTAPSAPYADFELIANFSPFSVNEAIRSNDTVRFYQKFYNYYAYDDGTPEAGYGLSSSNPNARLKLALRFDLNVPDTLRAVQMFFNQTKDMANQDEFILTVWQSVAGEPGDTLYTQEDLEPVFVDGINQYHTYELTRPVPVSGAFYVGWQQKSGTNLNLGYDRNYDCREYVRFNIGTGWNTSLFRGALMIRPVLGDTSAVWINIPEKPAQRTLRIFPNPASSWISIDENLEPGLTAEREYQVLIFNAIGQCVLQQTTSGTADVSALVNGLYFIRIHDSRSGQQLHADKIIIRH
jgi:hypothetical protein